jgi:4-hydroxythreonine-4-phosphate dehydrogenase
MADFKHHIDLPVVAFTLGDINGVGPEILALALNSQSLRTRLRPIIFGDPDVFRDACRLVGIPSPEIETVAGPNAVRHSRSLAFIESASAVPPRRPGKLDPEAGRCAMEWLAAAVDAAMDGHVDAIVTCPINKEGIHSAGYTCRGHTDFIADRTKSPSYRMALFAGAMRAVHHSDHVSLRGALDCITKESIVETIRITHAGLARLGIERPRIAVAGLNPHAGENGAFGMEEIQVILPAIEESVRDGIACSGPYPADTVFRRMRFDAVVAMYHDQGHGPMKLIAMDEGVNVTLGIPIVRTSPDHGTAYDIAGSGTARPDSMIAAALLAVRLAAHRIEALT